MEGTTPWNSEESSERYDCLFPVLPDYVAHYTMGGELSPKIGLTKHSLGLVDKIVSVQIADRLRISVTTAEKRYRNDDEEKKTRWLGLTDRIDTLFEFGRSRLGDYVSLGLDLPKRSGTHEDLYMQFFYRNVAAFDAAKRLSQFNPVPASVQELSTFLQMVDKYSDDVCTIFPRDVVLAKLDILLSRLLGRSGTARAGGGVKPE